RQWRRQQLHRHGRARRREHRYPGAAEQRQPSPHRLTVRADNEIVLELFAHRRYHAPMSDQPLDPTDDALPDQPIKGRGPLSNRLSRYFREERQRTADGWDTPADEDLPPLRTTVSIDTTKTIIARNQSPDIPFDRSINPYRGCEHGCIYCFARPTHAYLGLSPGLDFESRLFAKPEAAKLLDAELRKPAYKPPGIA